MDKSSRSHPVHTHTLLRFLEISGKFFYILFFLDYVYTTVRGFTVVYQETYVKTAKLQVLGLMECLVKRTILLIMYILIYHCERIHSGTSENLRQKWPRFANFVF